MKSSLAKKLASGLLAVLFAVCLALGLTGVLSRAQIGANADSVVTYLDATGEEKEANEFTSVTTSTTAWSNGWYVVSDTVDIANRVTVTGTVNLILKDGATLNAKKGITTTGATLNIYAQSEGDTMGKLISDARTVNYAAGIGGGEGGAGGTITINGGTITATGGGYAAGIGGGDTGAGGTITINGGTITATGGNYAAGIGGGNYGDGGTITINGGEIIATTELDAAGIGGGCYGAGGTVTISGGTITANGRNGGAGIGGGGRRNGGKVTINGGFVKANGGESGAGIGGGYIGAGGTITIHGGEVTATGGTNAVGIGGGENAESHGTLTLGDGVELYSGTDNTGTLLASGAEGGTTYTGERTLAMFAEHFTAVSYLAYDEQSKTFVERTVDKDEVTFVTAGTAAWGEADKETFFVVRDTVEISSRIILKGTVNLILMDNAHLNANASITTKGATLNIYAQSEGDTMGKLTATGGQGISAIGGNFITGGTVTIHGGTITATGGEGGAGIGGGYGGAGGDITIYGGIVTALGGSRAAAIGGGNEGAGGTITINGGAITATGGFTGAGIGGGYYGAGGTITINGGTITANGGTQSAGIGGGYNGAGGTITISDGTITATGNGSGAAIGGGKNGAGGTLTLAEGFLVKAGDDEASAKIVSDFATNHTQTWAKIGEGVTYLDENGEEQAIFADELTKVTSSLTAWGEAEKVTWLVVDGADGTNGTVEIAERVTVAGTVNLILKDGATLNAKTGITTTGATLNIYAQSAGDTMGQLIATGEDYAAAIGGGQNGAGGTVTVNGGVITANGGSGAAGIGGGFGEAGGEVTIHDGNITATGGRNGAGIGGGFGKAGGTITINGGTVTATGGEGGAGIGGGQYDASGTITIHGGEVTATGGTYGAGIGGGQSGAGGTITINGGTITANGGDYGAGIGGGDKGDGGTVTINGGTLTANGGVGGAGIGGGCKCAGGEVTINGGKVSATGGDYAAAIGAGKDATSHGTLTLGDGMELYSGTDNTGALLASGVQGGTTYTGDRKQAMFAELVTTVSYLAYDEQSKTFVERTVDKDKVTFVTAETAAWGEADKETFFVVRGTVEASTHFALSGTVNLILMDGAKLIMNSTNGSGFVLNPNASLTIYAQSTGDSMGELEIASNDGNGFFFNDNVSLTINGGNIKAQGNGFGLYMGYDCSVTINGGSASFTGTNIGIRVASSSELTINGGTVDVSGNKGIYCLGKVTINGGFVTATGKDGAAIGGSNEYAGTLTLGEGLLVKAGDDEASAKLVSDFATNHTQTWAKVGEGVTYLDENGEEQCVFVDELTSVTSSLTTWGEAEKVTWLVVDGTNGTNGTVEIDDRVTVNGTVNLILMDGVTLNANAGITTTGGALNIYAQSDGDTMGQLIATGEYEAAGIGGGDHGASGTINIYGGEVTATGGDGSAGIGGGSFGKAENITIYGGNITAISGNDGAGIGGGLAGAGGTITIYGGTVTAKSLMGFHAIGSGTEGKAGTLILGKGIVLYNATEADATKILDGVNRKERTYAGAKAQTMFASVAPIEISYLTWNETEQKLEEQTLTGEEAEAVLSVSAAEPVWGEENKTTWYIVEDTVTLNNRVTVKGTVNLILADNAVLNANQGITTTGGALNIFVQSEGDKIGKLTATGEDNAAGIGGGYNGHNGTLNIYGGVITANGGSGAAGIGGGSFGDGGKITIYGGVITANGGSSAAGIGGGENGSGTKTNGGTITIFGGKVTATGGSSGAGIGGASWSNCGEVAINGGEVIAIGGSNAPAIGGGYGMASDGAPSIAEGLLLKAGANAASAVKVTDFATNHTQKWAKIGAAVSYLDEKGEEQGVFPDEITAVTSSLTTWGEDGKETWCIAEGEVDITNRVTVNGTVNLILADGAKLTATKGITTTDGAFNVYAQSTGAEMGKLIATGEFGAAGIGGGENGNGGNITIFGGNITATGGTSGAGIGGGNGGAGGTITINGGTITASGNLEGAGIGGGKKGDGGAVTIYGGTITATGGQSGAAGIGGGENGNGGTVTIYGGTITASGGYYGAGIGGGNFGNGGTITIYGGDITANSGYEAAGIGGGYNGNGGDITINGGIVTATGRSGEAGIGGGTDATSHGTLTLGKNIRLYEGTNEEGTVLDAKISGSRVYTGERAKQMFATLKPYTAEEVSGLINNFKAASEVTKEDKEDIDVLNDAVVALGDAQENVSKEAKEKLADLNEALRVLFAEAIVGEVYYNTIAEAYEAVKEGGTLVLNNDVNLTERGEDYLVIAKNITLDLNGKNLILPNNETTVRVDQGAVLTVDNSSPASGGVKGRCGVDLENKSHLLFKNARMEREISYFSNPKFNAINHIALGYMVEELGEDEILASGYLTIIRPITGADLMETINNLASPFTYSEENKAAAENARTIYNLLSKDEQEKVENYETLTAAEKVIEDTEAAEKVTALIDELPEVDKIIIQDRDEVKAARAAYDNLTKDQKDLIKKETLEKLEAAEKRIAAIEKDIADTNAANRVNELLNALPTYEETTLDDEETVLSAREAYEALTNDQKAKVSSEALEKLEAAEKKIADLKAAKEVDELIAGIGELSYTTECEEKIFAARVAYDKLTAEQKALVKNYETLDAAEKSYAAVDNAVKKIDSIGTVAFTPECKSAIDKAREAYDSLTEAEKAIVKNLTVLTKAEEDYAAAKKVNELIEAIGSVEYEGTHNEDIEAAREAYEALTDEQKAALGDSVGTLTSAESTYADLKKTNETTTLTNEETKTTVTVKEGTGIPNTVELIVEVKKTVVAEKDSADYAAVEELLEKGEKIASVYDVKLVQIVNGVEKEIQPDEIEEGMVVTVRMAIPKGVSAKNLKVLHIHSYEDMEYVENFVVEGDEVVLDVDRFSEFAFVTPSGLPAWAIVLIVIAVLAVAGVVVFFVLKSKGVIGAKSNN